MKINSLRIQNYRSFKEIPLKDLNNLIILIGKNSSGKTNLLEALWLFFRDFSISKRVDVAPLEGNELLWFEGSIENPIEFELTIEFSLQEVSEIFGAEFITKNFKDGKYVLKIHRSIKAVDSKICWEMESISLGDNFLIKNGEVIVDGEVHDVLVLNELMAKRGSLDAALHDYKVKNSDQLKLHKEIRELRNQLSKAVDSAEKEDVQGKISELEIRRQTILKAIIEGAAVYKTRKKQAFEIEQKIDTLQNQNQKPPQSYLLKLEQYLKSRAEFLSSTRSNIVKTNNYGDRVSLVPESTSKNLTKTAENVIPKVRRSWKKIQSEFEAFSSVDQELSIMQSQPWLEEPNVCVPIYLAGAGLQEVLTFIHQVNNQNSALLLVEEPEQHLHPDLSKKLFKYLKALSSEKQVWISTHSPFFLDKNNVKNIFEVVRNKNGTTVTQLLGKEELKHTIEDIGVKPSDLLFSDGILLVEGATEEEVVPIWAKKFGIDFEELGIAVLSIRGAEKGKYHLKMWREICSNAQIPLFLLLDSHAQKELEEIINEKMIEKDASAILKVHSIEETYPKTKVIDSIKKEFGIDLKNTELKDTQAETIKNALTQKGMAPENWWKPVIGRSVANAMILSEIPSEVITLFEKIRETLRSSDPNKI